MPHIKFQTSPKSGGNSGSCAQALHYLEKEGKGFFDANRSDLSHDQAKDTVEHQLYKKGLKKDASKFYSVVFSFSKEELKGKSDQELIEFAKSNFAATYCGSIKGKDQDPNSLAWVAKLEKQRKYKGDHPDVKAGLAKSGQLKSGDNRHIHFLVSRKTLDDKQVSPMSNHFRKSNKGAVKSGFDQDKFKLDIEQRFDNHFTHDRAKSDRVGEKLKRYRPELVQGNTIELGKIKEQPHVKEFHKAIKEQNHVKALTIWQKFNKALKRLFDRKIHDLQIKSAERKTPVRQEKQQPRKTPEKKINQDKGKDQGMSM